MRIRGLRRLFLAASLAASVAAWLPSTAGAASVEVRRDIQFAQPEGVPLLLTAYLPTGGGPFPGVIVIHPGGWVRGDHNQLENVATNLAENGLAAFSVDYRLAPDHPYPAAVEDVQTAVQWVRDHAGEFDVDPSELGALGASSGGHLAGLLATLGQGSLDAGFRIRAAVSWSGPMDLQVAVDQGDEHFGSGVSTFLDCDLSDCADLLQQASPITYVDPSDAALFFANSTEEFVPVANAEAMDQALAAANVPHQLVEVPGDQHATAYDEDTAPTLPGDETVGEASVAWLQQYLTTPRGASPTGSPTSGSPRSPTEQPSGSPTRGGRPDRAGRESGGDSGSPLLLVLGVSAVVLGLVALVWAASGRRTPPSGPGRRPV